MLEKKYGGENKEEVQIYFAAVSQSYHCLGLAFPDEKNINRYKKDYTINYTVCFLGLSLLSPEIKFTKDTFSSFKVFWVFI